MAKIQSAVSVYQDEGLRSVVDRFHTRLLKPRLLSGRLAIGTDEITELADSRVQIRGPQEKRIQYDGLFAQSVPDPFDRILGTTSVRDQFCWEFADADVFGPELFVRTAGKYFVPSSVGWDTKDEFWRRKLAERVPYFGSPPSTETSQIDSAFVLTDQFRFTTNFGMWYYETLPKLALYSAYCDRTGKRPRLVVPELADFQAETLDMLGFTDRFEVGGERLRAEELIVPSQTGWSRRSRFDTPPSNPQWVRDALLATVSPSDRFADRVYISREDADFRYVENEPAVMETLRPLGFERYTLADMTLRDQMRLFAGADLVVGPHGAGMAHMIHTEHARFVELFPGGDGVMPYYFVLANDLNHDYEFLLCSSGVNRHPESSHPRHADLVVDPDELERVVSAGIADGP